MKPSMALKPLVFAIAAVMAVAVQAEEGGNGGYYGGGYHGGGHHYKKPAKKVYVDATAKAYDKQSSTYNFIKNEGTQNKAKITDSIKGSSGNVGVNVAAGDGNQQDNAAAIANAQSDNYDLDNSFVFGNADATAKVRQYSNDNKVINYNSTASAVMSGSANGGSGNLGVNLAAGDLNQQKNTMAIANANAPLGNATATASAHQSGPGLVVINNGDRTYTVDTLSLTTTYSGSQSSDWESDFSFDKSSKHSFDVSGYKKYSSSGSHESDYKNTKKVSLSADLDVELDASKTKTWTNGYHQHSKSVAVEADLDVSLDASIKKTYENSHESSFDNKYKSSFAKSFDKSSKHSLDVEKSYSQSSEWELSNTVTWQVLTPTGWANPVTNTATLSGSVTGSSGNVGVNVAAGVGNQQSNSLAIANTSM